MAEMTKAPWYWVGNHSLLAGHGKRPCVLSGRDLKQRDPKTGLLVAFDPMSPDGRALAAAPELLDALFEVLEFAEKYPYCGLTDGDGPEVMRKVRAALDRVKS